MIELNNKNYIINNLKLMLFKMFVKMIGKTYSRININKIPTYFIEDKPRKLRLIEYKSL